MQAPTWGQFVKTLGSVRENPGVSTGEIGQGFPVVSAPRFQPQGLRSLGRNGLVNEP